MEDAAAKSGIGGGAVGGGGGVLWVGGGLGKTLSNVGLNRNPCVTNAFGATFCGEDAKNYCRQTDGRSTAVCRQILGDEGKPDVQLAPPAPTDTPCLDGVTPDGDVCYEPNSPP